MKRGRGINGRDDKSSGIEIRMADALGKINPTDPLRAFPSRIKKSLNLNLNLNKFKVQVCKKMCLVQAIFVKKKRTSFEKNMKKKKACKRSEMGI